MKREGYLPTQNRDGTVCNAAQGDGSCGFPGSSGQSEPTQAGATVGFTAALGLGVAVDVGPTVATDGSCAMMRNIFIVAGPIAGYSVDVTALNVSGGNPSNGWSVGLLEKWAVPVGGFTVAPGYGSDGFSLQLGRSHGLIMGWGGKTCVQEIVGSCSAN